ncbi:MAG TPA: CDP-diacylglycerol diphosphatase [Steroidobacteraceae bacterium]|nr:CDP-diacylglycerol diphosphatase [Steroidobacteraceae bacterium]
MMTVRVLVVALVLVAVADAASTPDTGAGGGAPEPGAAQDRLWRKIHDDCVPAAARGRYPPLPCTEVDATQGAANGYAVLKDLNGRFQYLLLPLARVSGIESPALLAPDAPNYFADAWNARLYVDAALHRLLPRDAVVLIVNSPHGRTQDELHIHVGCIRREVRAALQRLRPTIGERWQPLAQPLPPHGGQYWARWAAGESLSVDPFKSLAAALPAGDQMALHSLAVTGARSADGRPGFILLSTRVDPKRGDRGNSDGLQDLACDIAAGAVAHGPVPAFQIVESVPEATVYGEPGVPRTQSVWLDMIRGAHQRIDIDAFYITDKPGGGALRPVLAALGARARAGVAVRVLVDQSFLKDNHADVDRLRRLPGIEVRVLPVGTLTGGVLHAKFMIVDGLSVFVGSQNWDWRALDQIHEIGARITDARFARTFDAAFDFDWRLAGQPYLPRAAQTAVQAPDFAPVTEQDPVLLDAGGDPVSAFPAFSPPQLMPRWITTEQSALVHMIEASRHVLRIQVMTFSAIRHYGPRGWWPQIDTAVRDAAARGVEVRVIVADWALGEPMQSYLKSLAVLPGVTVKFSHLPPAPQGFIPYARVEHAKYAVADDDSVYIGTGNWEWSYFNTTVDASVFVHGAGPAKTLASIFDRDWNGPYVTTLTPGGKYQPPRNH